MVYVDPLLSKKVGAKGEAKIMCHLFADTRDELLEFAKKIGLKAKNEINEKGLRHFDLTSAKRKLAINNGAMKLDSSDAIKQWWRIKEKL